MKDTALPVIFPVEQAVGSCAGCWGCRGTAALRVAAARGSGGHVLQLLPRGICSSHVPGDVTSLEWQKDFSDCKSDRNVITMQSSYDRRHVLGGGTRKQNGWGGGIGWNNSCSSSPASHTLCKCGQWDRSTKEHTLHPSLLTHSTASGLFLGLVSLNKGTDALFHWISTIRLSLHLVK